MSKKFIYCLAGISLAILAGCTDDSISIKNKSNTDTQQCDCKENQVCAGNHICYDNPDCKKCGEDEVCACPIA